MSQRYPTFEVIIVDNASTDGTVNKIEQNFANSEKVRLIKNGQNHWYSGGNNLGFQHSKGEMIVVLNPDLVVDNSWLSALVEAYERHPNAGIIGSNVLLFENRERINACANDIHITGFVFARFYGEDERKCMEEAIVAAPSGASFIFSTKRLEAIGRQTPFDNTRFFMDYSDIDLAIDFISHDFLCYVAPSSKVFHKFKFKMNPMRLFILESGRYQILGHFTRKALLMLLPALIVTELMVWYFIFTRDRKLIKSKIKVQLWLFTHIGSIFRNNNSRAKDLSIIRQMTPDIKLYDELSGSSAGQYKFHIRKTLGAINRLFRFTKAFLINSLYDGSKNELPDSS